MKIAFSRVVAAAAESLRRDVAPTLTDDYARGQVHAVVNLLKTLELRADWSAAFYTAQLARQSQAIDAVARLLARHTDLFPGRGPERPGAMTVGELFDALEAGSRQIVAMAKWARENRSRLRDDDRAAIEAALEAAMKSLNDEEWRHVAPQTLALLSGAE